MLAAQSSHSRRAAALAARQVWAVKGAICVTFTAHTPVEPTNGALTVGVIAAEASPGSSRLLAVFSRTTMSIDSRSGGGQLGLGGLGRHEPRVWTAAAADADLVAGGGALEVVAEVVAELVAADVDC